MTTDCIQCGQEMATTATNFCTVCCHNGLNDDLLEEHGYFQNPPEPEPEFQYPDQQEDTAQTGLSDFTEVSA